MQAIWPIAMLFKLECFCTNTYNCVSLGNLLKYILASYLMKTKDALPRWVNKVKNQSLANNITRKSIGQI